jgi:hypothetical protein
MPLFAEPAGNWTGPVLDMGTIIMGSLMAACVVGILIFALGLPLVRAIRGGRGRRTTTDDVNESAE